MASFSHYRVKHEHQVPDMTSDERPQETASFIEQLTRDLRIVITSLDENDIEFDLIGVDASIANALRRIMLAEVPTIAIEHVWIAVNNSIIQDEVLAHRIGLIPIRADPSKLEYVQGEEMTDKDTLVFHFDVECSVLLHGEEEEVLNNRALSGGLKWLPQGGQEEAFSEGVAPVHDDIVVAKLKPGQRIEFEAHCRKGVGKDHTKYSPVATASYRLLPDITVQNVVGAEADELVAMCPMKVFDIEDIGGGKKSKGGGGEYRAVAARPRDCTMCRECIRHPGWREKVLLRRKADHFLFTVESTGCMPPQTVVREALSILKSKASKFLGLVEEYEANGGAPGV